MTDLLEDRLRRSLSAVAATTPIPALPSADSLPVVRPLRRRVILGTAGVGIAATVTALAVVMSGGTDLAGPRAGVPKAPAPLSELQASAAADCTRGVASARAEQRRTVQGLPARAEQIYNAAGVDPRLASDLLYGVPQGAVEPLSDFSVDRICEPSRLGIDFAPPLRDAVRLGTDGRTIEAGATVEREAVGVPANIIGHTTIADAPLHGVVGHVATANPPGWGLRDVWWPDGTGQEWLVQTSGLSQEAAVSFAQGLGIDGATAVVTAAGWTDTTPQPMPVPSVEYQMSAHYGLPDHPTYTVAAGHVNVGAGFDDVTYAPGGSEQLVTVDGHPALISRLPDSPDVQLGWQPSPGVSVNVSSEIPVGGSTASLVAFASSLRLVAPDDPALVPVPMSSASAAAAEGSVSPAP